MSRQAPDKDPGRAVRCPKTSAYERTRQRGSTAARQTHLSAPEQRHGSALRRVAVLVGVRRYRGDPRHAEVERRDRVAQALGERQHETAQAAVHVEAALRLLYTHNKASGKRNEWWINRACGDINTQIDGKKRNNKAGSRARPGVGA